VGNKHNLLLTNIRAKAARWRIASTKKHGGANKRAGKNSLPLTPFLFARPFILGAFRGFAPFFKYNYAERR